MAIFNSYVKLPEGTDNPKATKIDSASSAIPAMLMAPWSDALVFIFSQQTDTFGGLNLGGWGWAAHACAQ
jgi:hypothetical protein